MSLELNNFTSIQAANPEQATAPDTQVYLMYSAQALKKNGSSIGRVTRPGGLQIEYEYTMRVCEHDFEEAKNMWKDARLVAKCRACEFKWLRRGRASDTDRSSKRR